MRMSCSPAASSISPSDVGVRCVRRHDHRAVDGQFRLVDRFEAKSVAPRFRNGDLARPFHRIGARQRRHVDVTLELAVDLGHDLRRFPAVVGEIASQQPVGGHRRHVEGGGWHRLQAAVGRAPGEAHAAGGAHRTNPQSMVPLRQRQGAGQHAGARKHRPLADGQLGVCRALQKQIVGAVGVRVENAVPLHRERPRRPTPAAGPPQSSRSPPASPCARWPARPARRRLRKSARRAPGRQPCPPAGDARRRRPPAPSNGGRTSVNSAFG